mmetsp:Transcript_86715/g.167955  ORF Transcript_86715/g.167955 Transcript_86715/m.167955 type:complete len:311 (+) Transcript_86715:606-1538(+)
MPPPWPLSTPTPPPPAVSSTSFSSLSPCSRLLRWSLLWPMDAATSRQYTSNTNSFSSAARTALLKTAWHAWWLRRLARSAAECPCTSTASGSAPSASRCAHKSLSPQKDAAMRGVVQSACARAKFASAFAVAAALLDPDDEPPHCCSAPSNASRHRCFTAAPALAPLACSEGGGGASAFASAAAAAAKHEKMASSIARSRGVSTRFFGDAVVLAAAAVAAALALACEEDDKDDEGNAALELDCAEGGKGISIWPLRLILGGPGGGSWGADLGCLRLGPSTTTSRKFRETDDRLVAFREEGTDEGAFAAST